MKMILYHGSSKKVPFPGIKKGYVNKDFYFGFYCTTYKKAAERLAVRFGEEGYLNYYEYQEDESLKCLKFDKMTDEWLDFIAACRLGEAHSYDIVEGPMVDDAIFNYVQNFMDGKISREAFWELVRSHQPIYQLNFHTISALNTLKFIKCDKIYHLYEEKTILNEKKQPVS